MPDTKCNSLRNLTGWKDVISDSRKSTQYSLSTFPEMSKCMMDILDEMEPKKVSPPTPNSSENTTSSSQYSSDSPPSNPTSHVVSAVDSPLSHKRSEGSAFMAFDTPSDSDGQNSREPDCRSLLSATTAPHINAILEKHLKRRRSSDDSSQSSSVSCTTQPEHHIYEEVVAEATNHVFRGTRDHLLWSTKPFAADPILSAGNSRYVAGVPPVSSQFDSDQLTEEDDENWTRPQEDELSVISAINNRPKQRKNIYSLLTQPEEMSSQYIAMYDRGSRMQEIYGCPVEERISSHVLRRSVPNSGYMITDTEYGFQASV